MVIYNVTVTDRVLKLTDVKNISVGGNKGDQVILNLDEEWKEKNIRGSFVWKGKYYNTDVINDGDKYFCEVPPIFYSEYFSFGIFVGENVEESDYLSSTTIEIPCKNSIRDKLRYPHGEYAKGYVDAVVKNAKIAKDSAEEAKKSYLKSEEIANELRDIYGDLDSALDSIIAIQEGLMKGGVSIPVIYGVYRFNETAMNELGSSATHSLEKTNVNFTSNNGEKFVAIDCSEYASNYYTDDGLTYAVHESGMFNNIGWEDTDLDFGTRPQMVTDEILAWVDYYMEKVG